MERQRSALSAIQVFDVELEPASELQQKSVQKPEPQRTPPPVPSRFRRSEPKPVVDPPPPSPAAMERTLDGPAPPPPAAAQAAQVLTQSPEAVDVVDFGESIVLGGADRYAGGVTQGGGTSARALGDRRARAHGVRGGRGEAPSAMDRGRPPRLFGGVDWDCPFPREADMAGVELGVVTLRVHVSAEGRVLRARVEKDPGHGFGREARRCAMRKRWQAGLDREGHATSAEARVRVRFMRP